MIFTDRNMHVALARKRLREARKKNPASVKGQLDFEKVEKQVFNDRVKWKGGLTQYKNVPESFQEE